MSRVSTEQEWIDACPSGSHDYMVRSFLIIKSNNGERLTLSRLCMAPLTVTNRAHDSVCCQADVMKPACRR